MVIGRSFAYMVMVFALVTGVAAEEQHDVPGIKGRINDYAGILSDSQKHQLHQILSQHQFATKQYITIVTAEDAGDESADAYAEKIVRAWDSPRKASSVLLLLLKGPRAAAIVAGDQLEKRLDRAEARRIVEEAVAPPLQGEDYDSAALEGVKAISGALNP